jgi:Tfp pilus assembly protein PilP
MSRLTSLSVATLALSLVAVSALVGTPALANNNLTLNAKGQLISGGKASVIDTIKETGRPPVAASQATAPKANAAVPNPVAQTMPRHSAMQPDANPVLMTTQAPIVAALPYQYLARTVRSPFMPPEEVRSDITGSTDLPDLQRYPLGDFTLVGIVWSPAKRIAMVATPDGKGYSVRVGSRIGTADGKVRRISRDAVIIEEFRTDVFGETKKYETVLALRPEESIP